MYERRSVLADTERLAKQADEGFRAVAGDLQRAEHEIANLKKELQRDQAAKLRFRNKLARRILLLLMRQPSFMLAPSQAAQKARGYADAMVATLEKPGKDTADRIALTGWSDVDSPGHHVQLASVARSTPTKNGHT